MALFKNSHGDLLLFDPKSDTLNLAHNKKYFFNLLVQQKVHLSETLTLCKVQNTNTACEHVNVTSPELASPAELSYENMQKRWGTAVFTWRGKTHRFCIDTASCEIYNEDTKNVVWCKCALLTIGSPLAAVCRTIYHVARLAIHLSSLPSHAYQNKECFMKTLEFAKLAFFDIFRAPAYGLLGVGAALYGLVNPYDGRRLYGHFERCLNRQTARVDRKGTFYLADCFIPLNFNVEDKRNSEMTIAQLKKVVLWKIAREVRDR